MNPRAISTSRFAEERKGQADFVDRNNRRDKVISRVFDESYQRIITLLTHFLSNWQDGLNRRMTPQDFRLIGESRRLDITRIKYFRMRLDEEVAFLMRYVEDSTYEFGLTEFALEIARLRDIPMTNIPSEDREAFEELMSAKYHGATYVERIWGKKGHRSILHDALVFYTMNVLTGRQPFGVESQRIMDEIEKARRRANQLIKTESQRVHNQTSLREFKRQGFTHYVYVTEAGACQFCEPLGNKIIPIEEAEEGYNFPLIHPNCYCSTYGVVETRGMFGRESNVDLHIKEFGDVKEAYKTLKRLL